MIGKYCIIIVPGDYNSKALSYQLLSPGTITVVYVYSDDQSKKI